MDVLYNNTPQTLTSSLTTPPKTQNPTIIPSASLVAALDLAAQSTRALSSSDDGGALAAISSLRSAHDLIGSFLSQIQPKPDKGPDGDEPMRDRGEEEEGGGETKIIEEVEEGIKECVLRSKRRKRRVSPSWLSARPADRGEELSSVDPMDRRRWAIDLVFQFHA